MPEVKATGLKKGMCIKMNNELYFVLSTVHITPGNWRGMVQSKLRNLRSGNQMDHRFRSEDMVERAILDETEMEFLYRDGDDFHFMNTSTYDQVHLHRDELGDNVNYLTPNMKLLVAFYEGRAVGIELPLTVELRVVETAPELKGATASAQRKPAITDTGLSVQVPPFIGEGELIRVSTEDGSYLERVKG
jgi:elongation factor P